MTVSTNFTIWGFMWTLSPTLQRSFEFSGWSNGQSATLSVSGQEQGMANLGAVKKTLTGSCFRHGLQLSPKMAVMDKRAKRLGMQHALQKLNLDAFYVSLYFLYTIANDVSVFVFFNSWWFFFPIPNCTVDYFKQY